MTQISCRRLMRFETTANTQPKQLEQQNHRLKEANAKVYYPESVGIISQYPGYAPHGLSISIHMGRNPCAKKYCYREIQLPSFFSCCCY